MDRFGQITVLIPTINESTLEEVITTVKNQAPDINIQILGYGTSRLIAQKHNVSFLDLKKRTTKSIAINRAMQAIPNPWIIILDADAIPEPGWAELMLHEFRIGRSIFSGSVDINTRNFWMKVYNLSMLHEFLKDNPSGFRKHLPAINLGFTKEFYFRNGPFSDEIVRSEDYEWTLRATKDGIPLFFSHHPVVKHIPVNKQTFSSVIKYWFISGYDNWFVREKYRDLLGTPGFFRSPWVIFLLSPIISIIPTLRIFKTSPSFAIKHIYLVPFIYLTKIAWCFGVFLNRKKIISYIRN